MTEQEQRQMLANISQRIDYGKIETAVAKGICRAIIWIVIFQIVVTGVILLCVVASGQDINFGNGWHLGGRP